MTVLLKVYSVFIGVSLVSFTIYLLQNENNQNENVPTSDGMPTLVGALYLYGAFLDKFLFNGGVKPKEEILAPISENYKEKKEREEQIINTLYGQETQ